MEVVNMKFIRKILIDVRGNIIGTVFVLKCKKCGDLKTKVVINTNLYGR